MVFPSRFLFFAPEEAPSLRFEGLSDAGVRIPERVRVLLDASEPGNAP